MLEYFKPLIDYLHNHPEVGALLAFTIALAESLPLIGTIIPGSVTMTAIGTLIGTGYLPGFSTLAWASLGALVGDSIGYGIGYLYTEKIRHIWPFKKYPHWLELSEKFFAKHGGKSIVIGRFVGPARSTIPLVAGLLKMKLWRFVIAAIPSAILWAVLYMVPGILVGALALELPPHIATEFIIGGVIVIVLLWLVFWAIQYFFNQLARAINRMVDRFWDVLIQHKPSRPFIRLIGVKGNPEDHYQLTLFMLFVLFALLFLFIFYNVVTHGWLTGINAALFNLLQSLHTHKATTFFIVMSLIAKFYFLAGLSAILMAGLVITKRYRAAFYLLLGLLLCSGGVLAFRLLYHNPRPEGLMLVSKSSSFPSGHTTLSTFVLSMIAYYSASIVRKKWIIYFISSTLVALTGISRLYLGAHWLTDVLGGLALGLSVLFFVVMFYRRHPDDGFLKIKKTYWFALLLLGSCVAFAFCAKMDYKHARYAYTRLYQTIEMSSHDWWISPTAKLPLYRKNRFGKPIQPFNLQWAGDLEKIRVNLKKADWIILDPKYSVKGTLNRFVDSNQHQLPLFPWLYEHKPPKLIAIKKIGNGQIVEIRLWESPINLSDEDYHLWIGSINYQTVAKEPVKLNYFKSVSLKNGAGLEQFIHNLSKMSGYQFKIITVKKQDQPQRIRMMDWDGAIIIVKEK